MLKGATGGRSFFGHSQTTEAGGRVVLLRMIPVAVVEGAANHADRVVVGFLRPLVGVRDLGELEYRISSNILRPISGRQICARSLAYPRAVTKAKSFFATRELQARRNSSKTWSQVRRFCGPATFPMKR
jgi:hypothetical protein